MDTNIARAPFFSVLTLLLTVSLLSAQSRLELQGRLPYADATLSGCWHYVADNGREYALVGTSKGLSIVDVSNPRRPREAYQVPMPHSVWREVKTWKNMAYVASEAPNSGLYILDLSALPDTVVWKTWRGDGRFNGQVVTNHTLTIADGYLYLFGGNFITNGTVICDLADPWNPSITGTYGDQYVHDGFVRNDTLWAAEIYAGQFSIIDVGNKTAPKLLASYPTPGAFCHNTWLSGDGGTLFTTDEVLNAPLTAFDVRNADNVRLLDVYYPSLEPSREVHNVRYINGYLVAPCYGGQLSIIDAQYPDNLIETAIVRTGTSLVWDADPYLPSGLIIATTKNDGLQLYKPVYARAARLTGTIRESGTDIPIYDASIAILETDAAYQTDFQGGFRTGVPKPGRYIVEVEKPGYEPVRIEGVELANGAVHNLDIAMTPTGALAGGPGPAQSAKSLPELGNLNSAAYRKYQLLNTSDALEINDMDHLPNAAFYLEQAGRRYNKN